MPDSFEAVVQLLLLIGLVYGATVAFASWRDTVPAGGASDFDFAHHQRPAIQATFDSLHQGNSI